MDDAWELFVGVLSFDILDLKASQQYLEQALAQAQEIGSWNLICTVSGFLALVLRLQQDYMSAEAILTDALEPDTAMYTIGQRLVWVAHAELALASDDPGQALDIADRLIASAPNLSNEQVIPRLWKLRAEALLALGRVAEAAAVLRDAQEAARVQGLRPLRWRISIAQGLLYRTQGQKVEAAHVFSTARALIEELAADLPEDEQVREQFLRQAMAGAGPLTSAELAQKTATTERYVREWLLNQAAGGYLEYDPETRRYHLPDEHALILADEQTSLSRSMGKIMA